MTTKRPIGAFLLGVALAGWADIIVLHQILQWHHLLSARTTDAVANTRADGVFGAVMWLLLLFALTRLMGEPREQPLALAGQILIGAGSFQIFDSIVSHAVLGLHHVWPEGPGGELAWDIGFFLVGIVTLGVGFALVRSQRSTAAPF